MNIFPSIDPGDAGSSTAQQLPLYREVAWDFERNVPLFLAGEPAVVEGKEALKVWIWKTLHTERYRWDIYTWDYGSELENLIGWGYREDVKAAEASRCLRECLLTSPYITEVKNISMEFSGAKLAVQATVVTIYGEVTVNANV